MVTEYRELEDRLGLPTDTAVPPAGFADCAVGRMLRERHAVALTKRQLRLVARLVAAWPAEYARRWVRRRREDGDRYDVDLRFLSPALPTVRLVYDRGRRRLVTTVGVCAAADQREGAAT